MAFELPDLPYEKSAFGDLLSAETFDYHWGKHHRAYVTKTNELVPQAALEGKRLSEVIVAASKSGNKGLFNNSAQVWNHTFFWNSMKPQGGGEPTGALAEALNKKFGSLAGFKEAFTKSAVGNFGSGWTWLVKKADGSVDIVNTSNAATPLTTGDKPLLTVDVWEHAYYIDYRNARPNFVETFLNSLVNWEFAAKNFA